MKKSVVFFIGCVFVLFFVFSGCADKNDRTEQKWTDIGLVGEESSFRHFWIENGRVYLACELMIENFGDGDMKFTLTADAPEDVKGRLLREESLKGYGFDADSAYDSVDGETGEQGSIVLKSDEFMIAAGAVQSFDVVFVGEHGGGLEKHDRLLPEVRIQIVPDE